MALDGIVVSNIVYELQQKLVGGRILKISQPEKDELILTIKNYDQYKLFMSSGAGLPLLYLTETNKQAPMTAPNFCMLLRKHLSSARILEITQPGLERIVKFKLEHLDEMGDVCVKYLIIEIMGKHSNIIFTDESGKIVDSIKHISGLVSSVREVLPGREYFIPKTTDKEEPGEITKDVFLEKLMSKPMPVGKALYTTLTGFSPLMANELCYRASIDAEQPANTISEDAGYHLYKSLARLMEAVNNHEYQPNIVYSGKEPVEFSSVTLSCYETEEVEQFESISKVMEEYFASKDQMTRIRQKSVDLRKILSNAIERSSKKYDLQRKQLQDTEKRDKFKIYGELLTTYGYEAEPGADKLKVLNYYTNEELMIPLDPTMSAMENAKKYFEKYSKQKRTFEALTKFILETKEELDHLDSIKTALDIALKEEDLVELKEELIEFGYIKRHYGKEANGGKNSSFKSKNKPGKNNKPVKKAKITSKPFHYISSDGYHMYVGKNNYQNDELTFEFANGDDWWFHAKGIPGSHVIVKSRGEKLPDSTYEEAAKLAAYYSKGREEGKVEIDYSEKKNIKKPSGGKPGFVVYYTNYSMMAETDISNITIYGGQA